jgi:hypothetical protein
MAYNFLMVALPFLDVELEYGRREVGGSCSRKVSRSTVGGSLVPAPTFLVWSSSKKAETPPSLHFIQSSAGDVQPHPGTTSCTYGSRASQLRMSRAPPTPAAASTPRASMPRRPPAGRYLGGPGGDVESTMQPRRIIIFLNRLPRL